MSREYPAPGVDWTPAYLASSIPWVTSSQLPSGEVREHDFTQVTKFIHVRNLEASGTNSILHFGFTQNGVTKASESNYVTLRDGESREFGFRVTRIYLSSSQGGNVDYEVVAGLTSIPQRNMAHITSSLGYPGVG